MPLHIKPLFMDIELICRVENLITLKEEGLFFIMLRDEQGHLLAHTTRVIQAVEAEEEA